MTRIIGILILMGVYIPLFSQSSVYRPIEPQRGFFDFSEADITTQLAEATDGLGFKKKVFREVEDAFELRKERLLRDADKGYFLYDDHIYSHCKRVFDRIKAANPELAKQSYRLLVSRSAIPNAACWGEGTLVINLGLLARLETEGQLAFVLAHELAHQSQDHVNRRIIANAEWLHSPELQDTLREIMRSPYYQVSRARRFVTRNAFEEGRHSRNRESEADSLGLLYMLQAGYPPAEAVACLDILDRIDEPLFGEGFSLEAWLEEISFTYRPTWVQYQPDTFYAYIDVSEEMKDSLKTHPDCQKRMGQVAAMLNGLEMPESIAQIGEMGISWQERCQLELLHTYYLDEAYAKAIHVGLRMIARYPEQAFIKGIIALSAQELYAYKFNHELGKVLPLPHRDYSDAYNQTLHFLNKLRLRYLLDFSNLCWVAYSADNHTEEFMLMAEILAFAHAEDTGKRDSAIDRYLQYYPEGRFRTRIQQTFR